jgi:hypothetical protein
MRTPHRVRVRTREAFNDAGGATDRGYQPGSVGTEATRRTTPTSRHLVGIACHRLPTRAATCQQPVTTYPGGCHLRGLSVEAADPISHFPYSRLKSLSRSRGCDSMTSTCENCGAPLHQASRGPKRRFCDDRCRKASGRVLRIAPGDGSADGGPMRRAASLVADEARRRRTLSAVDEAILVAVAEVAGALDKQPGSAALLHEWRGLIADIRREAPGQPERDLAALLEDFRTELSSPRSTKGIAG